LTANHDARNNRIVTITGNATLALLGFLIVVFGFREIYSPDLGFHLKAGEWILKNLKFPTHDLFTYTVGTHEYIDLHWIYQIFVVAVNTLSGEFGLVFSNIVVIVASFVLLVYRLKIKSPLFDLPYWQIFLFFAITSVAVLFETRPHVFSWLFLNLLLFILEYSAEGKKINLVFLPFIMVLWVNTHSLFILGWIVIGSYTLGMIWRDRKVWTPLTKYALISFVVCFLNPYFIYGVAYPFRQFQLLQGENVFKTGIAELANPFSLDGYFYNGRFMFIQPILWFHLFFIISIIVFVKRLKRMQLHELLLFLVFGFLVITAVRNIALFVFVVVPMTVFGLQPEADQEGHLPPRWWKSIRAQIILNTAIGIATLVFITAIVSGAYYNNYRSNERFGYRFNNLMLPHKAAQFLRENKLTGRILNHFNFGGFLMYMLPQQVAIDGRNEVMGEEFYYQYSTLWNAIDKKPILEKYQPEIIIFPHQNDFLWIHYFKQDTTWRLVYFDELAAIYLKKGYADSVQPRTYQECMQGYGYADPSRIDSILHLPYPQEYSIFSFNRQYFPQREMGLSTFCYYDDHFVEAIQIGLNGLVRSTIPCPEVYYDLGHYFFENKEWERSAYCYTRFLQYNSDPLARDRVRFIREKMGVK
jgi:hypothetical protein